MSSQIVLVTGGIGDIGTAIVKALVNDHATVIALDVEAQKNGDDWAAKLQDQGYQHCFYRKMDVTDFKECHKVISGILSEFGRIDVLINNAGITRDSFFHKMTEEQWQQVLRVNLDGMFNATRQVVEHMRAEQRGRIVNISSVNAMKGQYSQANYAASKSGVYGFTKSLAQELMTKNITVNSVSPGYVDTHLMDDIRPDILDSIIGQIPARRLAKPEEVAWAVAFLIDEKSQYITGANLCINGGLYMD